MNRLRLTGLLLLGATVGFVAFIPIPQDNEESEECLKFRSW